MYEILISLSVTYLCIVNKHQEFDNTKNLVITLYPEYSYDQNDELLDDLEITNEKVFMATQYNPKYNMNHTINNLQHSKTINNTNSRNSALYWKTSRPIVFKNELKQASEKGRAIPSSINIIEKSAGSLIAVKPQQYINNMTKKRTGGSFDFALFFSFYKL